MKARSLLTVVLAMMLIAPAAMAAETPAQSQGIKRTILKRTEVPNSSYEVVMVLVEVPANTKVGRHTHPGTVVGYLLEGEYTMLIEGRAPQALRPNDTLEVPSGVVHDEHSGSRPAKVIAVFTVEKGKPLASPVP
jgi:quercetin dioxygenase-like cupin family protein